ncbi:Flp family type IVb pilin [Mesorhizobium huakuii]|uniref:Flp family type IVb pilin n=1 Tax=Mesorhizobium huakuii TaxID=28104 RepID=UPI0024E16E80|nr:Flp family type IVb pilin [Mesorhizobium huakuii]
MRNMMKQFRDDENGAAMVEYSILIGIVAAASIVAVIAIGGWSVASSPGSARS